MQSHLSTVLQTIVSQAILTWLFHKSSLREDWILKRKIEVLGTGVPHHRYVNGAS